MAKARARPLVVGVLGGIASGKSSVAAILGERGAAVLDADAAARRILDEPAVRAALVARFGPEISGAGGVDRTELARRTFGHPEALAYLESLVHPRVRAELGARLDRLLSGAEVPAVVLDVPLLLESPDLVDRCDFLIHVESPPVVRRRRVAESRGWDAGELDRRERHQRTTEQKRRAADLVLDNEGSLADLRERLLAWLERSGGFEALPRRADLAPGGSKTHERRPEPRRDG